MPKVENIILQFQFHILAFFPMFFATKFKASPKELFFLISKYNYNRQMNTLQTVGCDDSNFRIQTSPCEIFVIITSRAQKRPTSWNRSFYKIKVFAYSHRFLPSGAVNLHFYS